MSMKEAPRIALTAVIVVYFGYALVAHYSDGIEETLKNIVMLAVGYWLGSSRGSADNGARMEKALALAGARAPEDSPSQG